MCDFVCLLQCLFPCFYVCVSISRKLASASWNPSCFSKVLGGGWNLQLRETFQLIISPLTSPSSPPGWFTSSLAVSYAGTPSATSAASASPAWFASSIGHASFLFNSLMQGRSWLACSFSCCACASTSHSQLCFCTASLFPALPKAHSDAEGGPLHLPQSLVIMPAMLNFFILFVQQYIHINNHIFWSSSPPTYIASIRRSGCSPYQCVPASDPPPRWRKSCAPALCPLCSHAKLPVKL